MDKKEKYINYIVEDMIKNTEIDYDREKIKYPFSSSFYLFRFILYPHSPFFSNFSKYITERYGIHDEDVDIIWKLYKGKIKEVIDNG